MASTSRTNARRCVITYAARDQSPSGTAVP